MSRRVSWALLAALSLLYLAVAARSPDAVGLWQDDAIYLATAKSLAEGTGYRHIELASQPLQTKYPVLYPAVLALAFLVSPGYPANLPLLLLPTAVAAAGLVGLSALYWRAVLRERAGGTWALAALAAASPAIVAFVRYTMSDLLYGVLAIAALLCLDGRSAAAPTPRAARGWVAAGAGLIGLAVLTRSIGVSLAGAAVLALLLRRRLADAGIATGVVLLCALPWWAWQAWAAAVNGPLQTALLEAPDLSYALWLPRELEQTLRTVGQNLFRSTLSLAYFQLALPADFVASAFSGRSWQTPALHGLCYGILALLLGGFARSFRRGWQTLHVYALFYAGMVLAWPFDPHRFLIPWTPFLLYFLLEGLRGLAGALSRGVGVGDRTPRWTEIPAWAAAGLLAVAFAAEDYRIATAAPERYFARELTAGLDLTEVRQLEDWIRSSTSASDVIASAWPARFFLTTGRRGFVFWPDTDPYARYYGPDRRWSAFYVLPSPSESRAMFEDMRAHMPRAYREAGIGYYVEQGRLREAAVFAHLLKAHPTAFERAYATPGGDFTVYRVNPSAD